MLCMDEDVPLCAWCGVEVPSGELYCSDQCRRDEQWAVDSEAYGVGATFTLDGKPVLFSDFITDYAEMADDERDAILALKPGEELLLGGSLGVALALRRET